MAIFTLSNQLRFVLGFTRDAAKLSDALNHIHGDAVPEVSPLLTTSGEMDAMQQQSTEIADMAREHSQPGGSPDKSMQAAADVLTQFQGENESSKGQARIGLTIEALEALARYLTAVPGRKNVIWFAGSFPVTVGGGSANQQDVSDELRNMTNELAAARVSLYPIRASGVPTDSLYDSSSRMVGVNGVLDAKNFQVSSLLEDSALRASSQGLMDEMADWTGGKATYGTNNLAEAMRRAIANGEHYYTITYSPTDKSADGSYRSIRVRLLRGRYQLQYRRGYYADKPISNRMAPEDHALPDHLTRLMDPDLPDLSQIAFKVRVARTDPAQNATPALNAPATSAPRPIRRPLDSRHYSADLAISMQDLNLAVDPDGKHEGALELMLVAFDRKGYALKEALRRGVIREPDGGV